MILQVEQKTRFKSFHFFTVERSLFAMPLKDEDARSKIFGDVMRRHNSEEAPATSPADDEPVRESMRREEHIVTAQPKPSDETPSGKSVTPPSASATPQEDDEAWGAIPSFLRRHKK